MAFRGGAGGELDKLAAAVNREVRSSSAVVGVVASTPSMSTAAVAVEEEAVVVLVTFPPGFRRGSSSCSLRCSWKTLEGAFFCTAVADAVELVSFAVVSGTKTEKVHKSL